MKMLILGLISVFSISALAGQPGSSAIPKNLKSCGEYLGTVRACIDIWPKTGKDTCTNTITSGQLWVDEFGMGALDDVYTTDKNYCDYFTDTVPYGSDGTTVVEYCCGG